MECSLETLKAHLQALLASSPYRFTPGDLQKALAGRLKTTRRQARKTIYRLVTAGELTYAYEDGHTFLVPSFQRPVRVSGRVLLTPPDRNGSPEANREDVIVRLTSGSAFGSGSHPTTRLAIRAIDTMLSDKIWRRRFNSGSVLDIGTGTGVLIIAALRLGMGSGLGIDVDPCARTEARQNVALNGFDDRIRITAEPVRQIKAGFAMVLANLRFPSLIRYFQPIADLTDPGGIVVLSGIQMEEVSEIERVYGRAPFRKRWQSDENRWAAFAFMKTE